MIRPARLELAMVLRRRTTWIALGLLILAPSALRRVDWGGIARPPADPVSFYVTVTPLLLVFAGLLIGAPLLSSSRRRRLEPIWARGPAAAGLAVRAWLVSAVVAGGGLTLSLALYNALAGAGPAGVIIESAAAGLLLLAPALLLALALAMVLGMLVGEVLAAAALITIVAVTAIVLPQSPLFGWTWLGGGTFRDALVGFGPDAGLVSVRAVLYTALAFGTALFGSWLFGIADPRSAAQRRSALLLLPALVVVVLPAASFRAEADARSNVPDWPLVDRGSSVRTRGLEVDLDCAAGTMRGVSTIEVVDAPGPVVLGLNPGLRVSKIDPPEIRWTQDAGGAIALDNAPPGTLVALTYEGALRLHRDDYQRTMPGIGRVRVVARPIRGYFSAELCFLLSGGDWYPRALGPADGPDGVQIPELRYRIAGDLRVIRPSGASLSGRLQDPPACALVAIAPSRGAVRPSHWSSTDEEQWDRLRNNLRRLGQYPDAEGLWLPLIGGGGGFGLLEEVPAADREVCLPNRMPSSREPLGARLMANLAATIAIRRQLVVEPRQAVREASGSTQDQGSRAMPGQVPSYLGTLEDALADTLDADPDALLGLRREALSDPVASGHLLARGVLPGMAANAAVWGIHEYRRLSGDASLTRLLGSLNAQAPGRVPSTNDLRSVLAALPMDQQRALAPLLDIR